MKSILETCYDARPACSHCGYGTNAYTLYRDTDKDTNKNTYFLEERFTCLTYEEPSFIWRGESVQSLIDSIRANSKEYSINDEEREDFISKLSQLIPPSLTRVK